MINVITLAGRITADPELKYTNSGISLCNFSLAVERNFKNANGEKECDFINCISWRNTADLVSKYCNKGDMIGVVGELQQQRYETREGEKRTSYQVSVNQVQFLTKKSDSSNGSSGKNETASSPPNQPEPVAERDDDLPF